MHSNPLQSEQFITHDTLFRDHIENLWHNVIILLSDNHECLPCTIRIPVLLLYTVFRFGVCAWGRVSEG